MSSSRFRVTALGLVVAVLAALLIWQVLERRGSDAEDARRSKAVSVAKAQVIDLTTLDSDSVAPKLKAMAGRTSGEFRQQLSGITNTFVKIVRENKIAATGVIDATGVTSMSDDRATVIVASSATVNQGKSKAATRNYRIKVSLKLVKGAWKIDGMEFVQ
jgi:hypothetical protein